MSRALRRLGVGLLGGVIVAFGLVMVLAPGPGLILLPAGLGVLALEFDAARRLQGRLATWVERWRPRRRAEPRR